MLPRIIRAQDMPAVMAEWSQAIHAASYETALRECLPILHEDFEDHFLQATGYYGSWAPRKDDKPHPLLILTGALIEAARDTGNPGNISTVGPRELETGVNVGVVKYAGFLQYGTQYMPPRPFIWASDAAIGRCLVAFGDAAFVIIVGV